LKNTKNTKILKLKSATILTLEQSKIKSNLIILELPTFAILQKREEEKAEPLIVTQKEVERKKYFLKLFLKIPIGLPIH